jgi:hypothetical protein
VVVDWPEIELWVSASEHQGRRLGEEGGNTSALWQKEGEGCDTINYSGPMIYGTTD